MPATDLRRDRRERQRRGGDWLREQRERRGWTTRHLAEVIGISNTQITNYETGASRVTDERAEDLARAFTMDIVEFRRGLGLWVPDHSEGPKARIVTPEEAIHADSTLRPGERDVLLATLQAIRRQGSNAPSTLMDYDGDPAESPWRLGDP